MRETDPQHPLPDDAPGGTTDGYPHPGTTTGADRGPGLATVHPLGPAAGRRGTPDAFHRLAEALTTRLGPDGWELADTGRVAGGWVAKVHTDWGWSGFVAGSVGHIGAVLAGVRDDHLAGCARLRCASCGAALVGGQASAPCPCGTVSWEPRAHATLLDQASEFLAQLADPPDEVEALVEVVVEAGTDGHHDEWSTPVTPSSIAAALDALVDGAEVAVLGDRLAAVVGPAATWRPTCVTTLCAAASALGYEAHLAEGWRDGDEYVDAWFVAPDGTAADLPDRFTVTFDHSGRWRWYAASHRELPDKPVEVGDDAWWSACDLATEEAESCPEAYLHSGPWGAGELPDWLPTAFGTTDPRPVDEHSVRELLAAARKLLDQRARVFEQALSRALRLGP